MPESTVIHILTGGPEHDIQVNGKRYHFEMHPYCGPILLDENGEAAKDQPMAFLEAVTLWAQQGRRIEDGLCRWDHNAQPIFEHISGRKFRIIGHHLPRRGE